MFVAGDIRANEQVGLTALHTLFVREHNRLAEAIASENSWLNGHEIYELARKIVGAQMQVITYNEFLPLLLGPDAIGPYGGYDPATDPTIANEFSTAAYRFGHSMLSPSILLVNQMGEEEIALREAFFNPQLITDQRISGLLRGLAHQQAQEVDLQLVDGVRNLMFAGPGGPGQDLAALNIQRARDHGLPDYNTTRRAYGLPPAGTFADVSSDTELQDALSRVYGNVEYLDLWVGGLAEDHSPGAMVGETFHTIISEQFLRLRDGDRYWHKNDPYFRANPRFLAEIGSTTLADVIRRNTQIGEEISDNVFGGLKRIPLPVISARPAMSPMTEGEDAQFTVLRSGPTDEELSIRVYVTETGTMMRDESVLIRQLDFDIGENTTTFAVATLDDAVAERDSTVVAGIVEADGYHVASETGSAGVRVKDNDSTEIRLQAGITVFEWPGLNGIPVSDALKGVGGNTAISDEVLAIYEWDGLARRWLVFFPALEDLLPGVNTLTAFEYGRTYAIATNSTVRWRVVKWYLCYYPGPDEHDWPWGSPLFYDAKSLPPCR